MNDTQERTALPTVLAAPVSAAKRVRRVIGGLLLSAAFLVAGATSASATPPTPEEQVESSILTAVTSAKLVITDNMPVIFGVAIAFVAWRVGKRVLAKI
jgi:hypothetical protein